MNIKLTLSFDGSNYHGWQSQNNAVTVQDTVGEAIYKTTGQAANLIGCSRTDAGVHATQYVANFRTTAAIPTDRIPLALNAVLPSDIAVYNASDESYDFHSVFSCIRKEYTYKILNEPIRNPLLHNRVWWYPRELDLDRMRRAAVEFIGEHDFSAMRSVGSNVKTTVRTVFKFDIRRYCGIIECIMSANGFLYNMARTMVGTLAYVSIGKIEPEDIRSILVSGNRTLSGPTAPPQGLYMTGVFY